LSTAPVFLKHPKCQSLSDLHRMGHAGARHLFYRLFAAPRHLARSDPAAWRLAQPSFGIATNEREVESKLDKAKTVIKRMIFDADYCGWGDYAPPEIEDETEISAEKWNDLKAKATPEFVSTPAVVIEREGNGPWVIIAAWRTTAGPILVEVGYCEAAEAKAVAAKVSTLAGVWSPAVVVVRSGSAAADLVPDLETAGIEVYMANRTEQAQACGGFLNAALAPDELMHSGQVTLDNGVSAAVKHKLPAGGFIWELIDTASYPALMGASLAHWALTKFGVKPKRKTVSPRTVSATSVRRKTSDHYNAMSAAF
jgi:hypothetical protein